MAIQFESSVPSREPAKKSIAQIAQELVSKTGQLVQEIANAPANPFDIKDPLNLKETSGVPVMGKDGKTVESYDKSLVAALAQPLRAAIQSCNREIGLGNNTDLVK